MEDLPILVVTIAQQIPLYHFVMTGLSIRETKENNSILELLLVYGIIATGVSVLVLFYSTTLTYDTKLVVGCFVVPAMYLIQLPFLFELLDTKGTVNKHED